MAGRKTSASPDDDHRLAWWALVLALVCGGALRWVWIEDMEWKVDEQWSYRMSQEVGRTRPWPVVGMPTSLKFPNPGLSAWTFVAIGRIAHSPTSMAHVIVVLNMIGLIGFAAAIRACLPTGDQEPWIWGIALQAVSPFAVRMSRKVWPPSILTPLLLLLWISHRYRRSRLGAFHWGLVGALIGQVHLSGWFVAAGLVLGTLVAEWRGRLVRSRFWHYWILGTVLGLLPAMGWVQALSGSKPALLTASGEAAGIGRLLGVLYGMAGTMSSAIPFAFLGTGYDTEAFLSGPRFAGISLHIGDLLAIFILIAVSVRALAHVVEALAIPLLRRVNRTMTAGAPTRANARIAPTGDSTDAGTESPTVGFYLWSTVAIPCLILVVLTNVYFYHYFFAFCPFMFVLVAAWMLPWRRLLLAMVVAQALMCCVFLNFMHDTGGTGRGEYGFSYGRQKSR